MPKSPAEIRITTGTIIDGQFYNAGEVLPYTRIEDLPASLRRSRRRRLWNFYHPSQRDIYGGNLPGQSRGLFTRVYLPGGGCSDKLRRLPQSCKRKTRRKVEASAEALSPETFCNFGRPAQPQNRQAEAQGEL